MKFAWTEAEFDRSETELLKDAMVALLNNNSEERFRLLAIVQAKQRGGPRSSPEPDATATKPRWIGRFEQQPDGVYRIVPGSENQPP